MRVVIKSFDQKPPFYVCRCGSYSFVMLRDEVYEVLVKKHGYWDEVRFFTEADKSLPGYEFCVWRMVNASS